jgi:Zn finger protein HypA/HybF involved in hydrogenase expression
MKKYSESVLSHAAEVVKILLSEDGERFSLEHKAREYECTTCGSKQMIKTNHTSSCFARCENCSCKGGTGKDGKVYNTSLYDGPRKFKYVGSGD